MVQLSTDSQSHRPLKLIVLDRDGVINHDSDQFIKSPAEWRPIPGSLEAIARLNQAGYRVVVATNQSGVGRGLFGMTTLTEIHEKMFKSLNLVGGRIDAVFYCPHAADSHCDCRKPKPGLMRQIALRYGIDLRTVPMLCDTVRDLQAAQAAGCEPHLVLSGRAANLTEAQLGDIVAEVPGAEAHRDLGSFVDFLLQRAHVPDSSPMGLH